jgi:hypothetical protein
MFGAIAGLVSVVLLGFYGPIAAQETKILATSIGLLLGMLAMLRLMTARTIWSLFAAGLLLGLGALARPDMLLVTAGPLVLALRVGAGDRVADRPPCSPASPSCASGHNLAAGDTVPIYRTEGHVLSR